MRELIPWLRLLDQRRRRLVVGALLILLTLLSGLGLLALSGWFITATAVTGLLLAAGIAATLNIYVPGGGIRLFAVTRTVARYLERVYNHDTVLRLLADIRVRLFQGLAQQPVQWASRMRGADWLSRLTTDLDAMDTLYLRLLAPTGLAVLVSGLLVLSAGLWLSTSMAIAIAIPLGAALLVATALLYRRTRSPSAERSERLDQLRGRVIEHLEGQAELRAAGLVQRQSASLRSDASTFSTTQSRVDQTTGWHQAFSGLLVNLAALAALWSGLALFGADAISGPVAVILPLAVMGLLEVYAMLPDAFGRLGATQASARRLNADCTLQGRVSPSNHGIGGKGPSSVSDRLPGELELKSVNVRRGSDTAIPDDVSLSLNPGDRVGIVGPSGCGKSTIADVLAGLIDPDVGTVHGADSHHVAYLTQRTVLFDDSVRNNLVPDGRPVSDDRLWRVLELVHLGDRVARMPGQLDGWLGTHGEQLSGGEGRRLALARVLLCDASLVILDEPFTGVDGQTQHRICQQLDAWLSDRTLIALGHSERALTQTTRTVRLGEHAA